jgi:hypothetical protein
MDFGEAIHLLVAESEHRRLVERAFAEFNRWVEWQGGTVSGIPRAALSVSFRQQALVFRTELPLARPHVVTELAFEVRGPDEGPTGVYQLLSTLDGEPFRERVTSDIAVSSETGGRGAWYFNHGHYEYNGDVPRRLPDLDPNFPW